MSVGPCRRTCKEFLLCRIQGIPSDTFRVEVENPDLGIQEMKDGTLSFTLKDASGPMPKDVVRIYTNDVRRISMIYSELIADRPFAVDSLSLSLASGSKGRVNVKTKYLQVSAGGCVWREKLMCLIARNKAIARSVRPI